MTESVGDIPTCANYFWYFVYQMYTLFCIYV